MIQRILRYVRERRAEAQKAPPSDYRSGAVNELMEAEEFLLDLMWEEGEDDEDQSV